VLREKAKAFISGSVAAGEPFFLYLAFKGAAPAADPGAASRRALPERDTVAAAELQRARRLDKADLAAGPSAAEQRAARPDPHRSARDAAGGRRGDRRQPELRHHRHHGAPAGISASPTNTFVVFFADNGWLWGEHRLRAKNQPYEESIRAPDVVRYPKLAPLPRVETRFALNIDLAPTFAELAGVGVPLVQDGRACLHVLDGTEPAGAWRTDFLAEAWPGSHPVGARARVAVEVHRDPDRPGNPRTAFEREHLRHLDAESVRGERNVAGLPENAGA
jgi:hypothetical protein